MRGLRATTGSICILLALAAALVLTACTGDGPTQPAGCDAVGGNRLSARVDGGVFCAATVTDATLAPGYHQIVGFSADGRMLHLVIPLTVGSFDLSSRVGIGGSYLPAVAGGTTYLTIGENGRITVSELTPTRARGTFEFVALGYHQDTGEALGSQVIVTDGAFDAALTAP